MTPDAAAVQLEKWFVADQRSQLKPLQHRLQDLEKLPVRLQDIVKGIYRLNSEWLESWDIEQEDAQPNAWEELLALSASDRRKILGTLLGELGDDVEYVVQRLTKSDRPLYISAHSIEHAVAESGVQRVEAVLNPILRNLINYDRQVLSAEWLAEWIGHLNIYSHGEFGFLLATIIDNGGKKGDKVFTVLCQALRREHEVAVMDQTVLVALMIASNKTGWDLIEKMMVAAQRQEGLRQSILEATDWAHPDAFRRMVRLIVDHNLTRFSAVIRMFDEWFGTPFSSLPSKKIEASIQSFSVFLDSPPDLNSALDSSEAEIVYLALRALAIASAHDAVKAAGYLVDNTNVEHRLVTATFLGNINTAESIHSRLRMLGDEDIRVALTAANGSWNPRAQSEQTVREVFVGIVRLLDRMPDNTTKLESDVWLASEIKYNKRDVADLLPAYIGKRSPVELMPYIDIMQSWGRVTACTMIVEQKKWNTESRAIVLDLAGDKSENVRAIALAALEKFKPKKNELDLLASYLTRKVSDLRNGVIAFVLNASDAVVVQFAANLLGLKNQNQRLAGLELLRKLAESGREPEKCTKIAEIYREGKKALSKDEQVQVDAIISSQNVEITFDNCIGLADLNERTDVVQPIAHKVSAVTRNTAELLKSLNSYVHEHRDKEITVVGWDGTKYTLLLGEAIFLRSPSPTEPIDCQLDLFPAAEFFCEWFENLPAKVKDRDGFHLLRAIVFKEMGYEWNSEQLLRFGENSAEHNNLVTFLRGEDALPSIDYEVVWTGLEWLLRVYMPNDADRFALDVAETVYALVPESEIQALTEIVEEESPSYHYLTESRDFRQIDCVNAWLNMACDLSGCVDLEADESRHRRLWTLFHWLDEPVPGAYRRRPPLNRLADAYRENWANMTDVYDQFIGPRFTGEWRSSDLSEATQRVYRDSALSTFFSRSEISSALQSILDKLFEIEIARGESATTVSHAILSVKTLYGIDRLVLLLGAIGKSGFKVVPGYGDFSGNRSASFTSLVRKTYPAPSDTPVKFSDQVKFAIKAGQFPQERLLHLAFLAPQWRDHIAYTLGWRGFTEGIYWFMAHMKYIWIQDEVFESDDELHSDGDQNYSDGGSERLSAWEKIIRERTHLTEEDRWDGAIDVDWFRDTYAHLTPKRWVELSGAARYAASGSLAKRAQLVADVLTGKCPKKILVEGIKKRYLKEHVRLLGLLPLAKGNKRERDLQDRYEILESYRKYANNLGSMSRPEAIRAFEIGLQNLASTAGFTDPYRMQWALEASATADLSAGPVEVSKGDISISLVLDDNAEPDLTIKRGEKPLKSLPKAVAKEKKFIALRDRSKHIKQQNSRIKRSLEEAMCRCDEFTGEELVQLSGHALLSPQLQRLVLVSDKAMGYPNVNGKSLVDCQGKKTQIKKQARLRIAHPYDLFKSKLWSKWQRECFDADRLQPFKQVFRELYTVTAQEKKDKDYSNRYAGHQVERAQAFALWGRRGWSRDEYENVWKAFYNEPVNVEVQFDLGYAAPLEREGLALDKISFLDRENHKNINLAKVPPILFSEVMRDLDLVVSVAHAGEVDPEASASTVEMRAALLKETCQLLKLKNIRFKTDRALIKGSLADYSVHLGSGVVHKLPGGSICLVPVNSQHRGRLFLPFADDDPRTAEVIAKSLLLARDEEIDDPGLLAQIRN